MGRHGRWRWVVIGGALSIACGGDDGGVSDTTGQEPTSVGSSVSVDPASAEDDDGADDDAPADDGGPGGPGSSGDPTDATMGPGPTGDDTAGDTSGAGIGCEGAPWLVCEDFEAATIGENPDGWDLRPSGVWGGGGMGTTDELAASGGQSFRLQSAETGAQWLTYMGDISAFADGHWGRMYFRMSAPVPWPSDGVIHGDLFEARGNWEGSTHQVRWAVINNPVMQHNWGYNVQTSNAGEFIHETGYVYPWTERWLCIEWHHDRVAQTATLWVDGEEILAVTPADDPQIPVFDDISVGWANYQPASPQFVVHIDDVALHAERIGC